MEKKAESKTCGSCGQHFGTFSTKFPCFTCKVNQCHSCTRWLLPAGEKMVNSFCLKCYDAAIDLDMSKTFDVFGPENAKPIVLIHGGSGNRKQWAPQIPELSKYYRLYVPDLPGHGSRYKEKLTFESAFKVIFDLINAEIPSKKAIIIGYSLGGYVAVPFVAKYPDLCEGLVAGGIGADTQGAVQKIAFSIGGFFTRHMSPMTITKFALEQGRKEGVSEEDMNVLLRSGAVCNIQNYSEIHHVLVGNDPSKNLLTIQCPVLFVNGEKDTRNGEQKYLKHTSHGKLVVIKGVGHLLTHVPKHNAEFIEAILKFAEQVGYAKFGETSDKPEVAEPKLEE